MIKKTRARPGGLALGIGRGIQWGLWRLMVHLDRRRGFGVGGGRGVFGRGGSRWGGAGEEAARGFLATAIKIGHGKVLLELVMHRFEIFC